MKLFKRIGIAALLTVCAVTWAGSAWAANFGGENFNDEDLAVIQAMKTDNPGFLATINMNSSNIVDFVIPDNDFEQFPPSVKIGDVMKGWIRDGAELGDYSGDLLGWEQVGSEWRVMYLMASGASLTDASKLRNLPNLRVLCFDDTNPTSIALPNLENLYSLWIMGNGVTSVNVSNFTNLTVFRLGRTSVQTLTLPPSPKLAYFRCEDNSVLTEVSGFYAKEAELEPLFTSSSHIFDDNSALREHTITITPSANGTITKNGGDQIYNGDSVTFTVKANSGYKLGTLTINGSPVTLTGNTYTHKATGNVTAAATFVEDSGTDPATPNDPPSADDNTTVIVGGGLNDKIVKISVKTKNGDPIPANVLFKVWLLRQSNQRQNVSSKAASDSYIGPFVVTSIEGSLNIDVDNLKNPDGTKASIAAGSYIVKFADADEKYVGTTESINLEATSEVTPPAGNNDGGGGCNTGYGLFGLLLAGILTFKYRKA